MVTASSADLDVQRRAVRDAILAGPRKDSAFPLVNVDGTLAGPFGLMERFPLLGAPLQALGTALRFQTKLSARQREIVILRVAGEMRSSFEAYAHAEVGRSAGLRDAEIKALLQGEFSSSDPVEQRLAVVAGALTCGIDVDRQGMDDEMLAEVVAIVGYYRLIAQLMTCFGVVAPADQRRDCNPDAGRTT